MKIKPLISLFLLILFYPSVSILAQSNFISGDIVKLNGDTIKGFIDYRDWDNNPEFIRFKENLDSRKEQFFPRHLKSFTFSNQLYVSSIVPIIRSTKKRELISRAELTSSSRVEVDTVFLSVLVIGEANLFYYSERNNQIHYFIETDSVFDELIYSGSFRNTNGSIRKVAEYKEQLKIYLKRCEGIEKKIDRAGFTDKGLTGVIEYYNGQTSSGSSYVKKTEKVEFQPFFLGGISSTQLRFGGTSAFQQDLKRVDFGWSFNPDLALALNIVLPRTRKSISFYNELLFTSYKFDSDYKNIKNITTHYAIEAFYLKLAHLLRYYYPKGEFRPFFNAGISNGIALSNQNSFYIKDINGKPQPKDESPIFDGLKNYELSYLVGIGAFYKRFSFELRFEQGNGIATHDYGYLTSKTNRFHFFIGYQLH